MGLQAEHSALLAHCQLTPHGDTGSLDGDNAAVQSASTVGAEVGARDAQADAPATTPQGQTAFLWPTPLQLIPLATDPENGPSALVSFELCSQLRTAALKGLSEFQAATAADFPDSPTGRTQLHRAYAHWQRDRSAAVRTHDAKGAEDTAAVRVLEHWGTHLGAKHLSSVCGLELEGEPSEALHIVVWPELLGQYEMLLPQSDPGALVAGALWVHRGAESRRWVFQDPRGINAPFGRRYEVDAAEGTLVLFPPWLSVYVEPGGPLPPDRSPPPDAVLWRFLLWPPVPRDEWSWVDDPSGSIVRREVLDFDDPR